MTKIKGIRRQAEAARDLLTLRLASVQQLPHLPSLAVYHQTSLLLLLLRKRRDCMLLLLLCCLPLYDFFFLFSYFFFHFRLSSPGCMHIVHAADIMHKTWRRRRKKGEMEAERRRICGANKQESCLCLGFELNVRSVLYPLSMYLPSYFNFAHRRALLGLFKCNPLLGPSSLF